MKKIINILSMGFPFAAITIINSVSMSSSHDPNKLILLSTVFSVILLGLFIIQMIKKEISYFLIAIGFYLFIGTISLNAIKPLALLFAKYTMHGLYLSLFLMAALPPLFKIAPFTYQFSKKDYPEAIQKTRSFKVINLIMNYIWAGIFLICFAIYFVPLPMDLEIVRLAVPFIIIFGIGFPMNKKLPPILQGKINAGPQTFDSVKEMFEAMPMGLNREKAKGIDVAIQFYIKGSEQITGFLIIKNSAP